MRLRQLERQIVAELREVTGLPKLRLKDLMEWKNSRLYPEDGEDVAYLPKLGMWAAYTRPPTKRKETP